MASAPASTMEKPSPAPSVASSVASAPAISTPPPTVDVSDKSDDPSKLKTFLSILRKFIGVTDIAAVRFSLPSQLMEPIPNLEYWHYLDRPETFTSIGKSDDEVGRMLEVLRFWFTKDLKYVKGKPCKPYNSALGEFFRCNWDIAEDAPSISLPSIAPKQPLQDPLQPSSDSRNGTNGVIRTSFLTEQTSHHPPVSAYWYECAERGISARGYDQLSAKFTGTAIRVIPGNYNQGIFLKLHKRDNEEYQLTHPAANLGGLLRGALSVTVSDVCYVTCPKNRIKTILHYLDEGWIGRSQNIVQGVVFRYDPKNDKITRTKDVPEKDILARVEGCWKEQVYYSIPETLAVNNGTNTEPTEKKQLLIDLVPLMPVPKIVPPEQDQLPNESRLFWRDVTNSINSKQWAEATKFKQLIEERQRTKAAERKENNVIWKPRFFMGTGDPPGRPELSEEGIAVLRGMQDLKFYLKESEVTAS